MNERKLTKSELAKREDIIMKMKDNKRALVQKYGKDAEAVMYGRATNLAKKKSEGMDQDKIKELVKDALQNPKKADLNKDGKLSDYEEKRGAAIEKNIGEVDATEKAASDKIGRGEEFTDDDASSVADKMPKIGKDKEFKLMEDEDLKEFGSSDMTAMMNSIHRSLGEPKDFPGLSQIIYAAEDAVDFYWDDWDEYQTDRDGLIMSAAQRYARQYHPEFMAMAAKMMEPISEDLDLGHQDNEPHMLKADLYRIGKYAMELYQMVDEFEAGSEEVDFPHWWQAKIIKSKDMLVSAKHYLDFEVNEPQIDAMVDVAQDTEAIDEFDDKSMKAYGDAVKKAYGVKDRKDKEKKDIKEEDVIDENAIGINDRRLDDRQKSALDRAVRGDSAYSFGNNPYADDQLRYKYAVKMGFLEETKDLKEGVWSLGSINDIKAAIQTMEMGLDMDDTELEQHLQDNDAYFYNVLGDDELHDPLSRAYDLAAMGNEDRAHNELSDAIGRAYDLLKMQMGKEQDLARPNTSPFGEIAEKLAQQLKSK